MLETDYNMPQGPAFPDRNCKSLHATKIPECPKGTDERRRTTLQDLHGHTDNLEKGEKCPSLLLLSTSSATLEGREK